ncbi:MAG: phosphate/phosphite/phosphonate ABC transporter substrate-binding protein [Rhodocyclaceae bacterium]|nr:phosphate/phosphite/phosphonate ABC transporter substrate-binding protein [Rhodocyclaceae bacterium]
MKSLIAALAFLSLLLSGQAALAETFGFGVLSQRSAVLTAEHWNPILEYVGKKAGVELALKIARTGAESAAAAARGEYDFIYSNHIFTPAIQPQGYRVILRPRSAAITGQIVTLADSPIRDLPELAGKTVGFPSKAAFVGYAVPMDHLLRQGIPVESAFGGNQEGVMGQLVAGKVIAAGVNDQVMAAFASREGVKYRVLWQSQPFHNLPIAAHPRVPDAVAARVAAAIAGMNDDAEGRAILEASARVIGQKPPLGFLPSSPADYRNYPDFYRRTLVKDIE